MSPLKQPDATERERIIERLNRMVRRWPEVSGCHLNPDPVVVEGVVGALAQSVVETGYSYCPCRDQSGDPRKDRALICPCDYHQDELVRDGHCKCVLFVSDAYDAERAYTFREDQTGAQDTGEAVAQREVTVYVTRWCGQSRRALRWLEVKGIAHEVIDIDHDDAAAERVRRYNAGNRSVPTLVVRTVLREPSPADLERLLLAPGINLVSCDAYVTAWCGQSRRTLAWLRENAVATRVIDIGSDAGAAARLREWHAGSQSVPTLEVILRLSEPDAPLLERVLG